MSLLTNKSKIVLKSHIPGRLPKIDGLIIEQITRTLYSNSHGGYQIRNQTNLTLHKLSCTEIFKRKV